MNLRVLYHLIRADFLERIRGYRFLIILLGAIFFAYQVIIGNINLHVGPYRGIYNSAWVGMLMAMTTVVYVSLLGFYIIRNTIERDRSTRMGEILAPTKVSNLAYLFGKFLSNFAVLGFIAVIMIVAAVVMQLSYREDVNLDIWPLLGPFVLFVLPVFLCIAALAVLFECIPFLAGGYGGVLYIFLWIWLLVQSIETENPWKDFLGIGMAKAILVPTVRELFPNSEGGFSISRGYCGYSAFVPFPWKGIDWTVEMIAPRLFWIVLALVSMLVATVVFDRFDTSRARHARPRSRFKLLSMLPSAVANISLPRSLTSSFDRLRPSSNFAVLVLSELRLMLKGRQWWWYAGAVGLLVASLTSSLQEVRMKILPYVWLWPIVCWSALGVREIRWRTREFILSSAYSERRQLPAAWVAGVLVAVITGSGVALRLIVAGDLESLIAWAVGALFIPAMALACGILSGSSRLFEGTYLALVWHIGLLKHQPSLDFLAPAFGKSVIYLVLTIALLGFAFLARQRQLRR